MSIFFSVEMSKMNLFFINHDSSPPLSFIWSPTYPKKAAGVSFVCYAPILKVYRLITNSKPEIFPPIVATSSVNVVNMIRRKLSDHIKESKPMGEIWLVNEPY